MSKVVCVTGASGAIGSWVVRLLLERGYTVHATVQDLEDENETKHLEAMEGAKGRLHFFVMDLLDIDSIAAAVKGCHGVIHLACPNIIGEVKDPELYYPIAKTLAEKAGWEFAKETGFDVVMINPGTALGPLIPPRINSSMAVLAGVLKGDKETYEDFFMGMAHFKDIALAHILGFEKKEASGRHLCVEAIRQYGDFVDIVADLYPEYPVVRVPKDKDNGLLRAKNASKKLIELGLDFTPAEQIIKDAVESLKSRGLV